MEEVEVLHWPGLWRRDNWSRTNDHVKKLSTLPFNDNSQIYVSAYGAFDADSLSNEIWLLILGFLPIESLTRVMVLLSWRFHHLSAAILYQEIDASLHRYRIPDGNSSADFSWAHWDCDMVHRRQQRLIGLLTETPRYAPYVRSLHWTMGMYQSGTANFELPERLCLQITLFGHFENVTCVDIDTGFARLEPVTHDVSNALFPKASIIRLGGVMPYRLATAILHGKDKAPIRSLLLFNVIDPGMRQNDSLSHIATNSGEGSSSLLSIREIPNNWSASLPPSQVRPGCMRRLLNDELQERCLKLDRLFLRKQGQQHSQQIMPSEATYDDEVYSEWAEFIEKTQPRHLRLEHGGATTSPLNGRTPGKRRILSKLPLEAVSPMDIRFQKYLSPILSRGWQRLESLHVHGVCSTVTAPLVKDLSSRLPAVQIICESTVSWCWNGMIADPILSKDSLIQPLVRGDGDSEYAASHSKWLEAETSKPRGGIIWLHPDEKEDCTIFPTSCTRIE